MRYRDDTQIRQYISERFPSNFEALIVKPIVPWCAKTYFADPSKWEIVPAIPSFSGFLPALNLDGTLKKPDNWQGMREKAKIRTYWVNLYSLNRITWYSSESSANEAASHDRIGPARKVEIEE